MRILHSIDWFLFLPMVLLLGLSLFMLASLSLPLLTTQIIATVLSVTAFFLFSQIDYHVYQRFAPVIYIISIFALGITLFWGIESHGSIRWIPVGPYRFQTSEFIKPLFIVSFAAILLSYPPHSVQNMGRLVLFLLLPFFFTFVQPDLGSAIVLAIVWAIVVFIARIRLLFIVVGLLLLAGIIPLTWNVLRPYQQARISSYLYPARDPLGAGYGAIQSQIAVGSGQLFGRGLGRGIQTHLQFLPAHTTDFMFASIAEELGFVMVVAAISIYTLLLGRLLFLSLKQDRFGLFVLIGVFGLFFAQVTIHIGMNLGLIPITGITLPFLSYGGSSVVAFGMALGIAGSVGRRQKSLPISHIHSVDALNRLMEAKISQ